MSLTILDVSHKKTHTLYPSVTDLFYLPKCLPASSMLSQMTELPSFLRLNNIPLYVLPHF